MEREQTPPRLGRSRIAELYKGHEVATHTMTHPTIERCPLTGVAEEILEDRKGLEHLSGDMLIPMVLTVRKSSSCSDNSVLLMPEWYLLWLILNYLRILWSGILPAITMILN